MSNTLTDGAMVDARNRLIHSGLIALMHQMRAEGIACDSIAASFTAAGLMSEVRQQGDTWLSMNSIGGHGATRAAALVNWLNVATAKDAGEIKLKSAVSAARLQ